MNKNSSKTGGEGGTPLYPLIFEPILVPKVWGGSRLQEWGKGVGETSPIGESWEVCDLRSGGAISSVLANGPLAGMTLREMMDKFGDQIISKELRSPAGGFPLLIKYLDATQNLSVQVHPSPTYAKSHPEVSTKDEIWYSLEANDNPKIYGGLQYRVEMGDIRYSAGTKDLIKKLVEFSVMRKDLWEIPSGTIHALGAGNVIVEIQSVSDTTFRVYDWERDRPLQIAEAIEATNPRLSPKLRDKWASTDNFSVSRHNLDIATYLCGSGYSIIVVAHGHASIASTDNSFDRIQCPKGTTVLIPSTIGNHCVVRGEMPTTTILHVRPTATV